MKYSTMFIAIGLAVIGVHAAAIPEACNACNSCNCGAARPSATRALPMASVRPRPIVKKKPRLVDATNARSSQRRGPHRGGPRARQAISISEQPIDNVNGFIKDEEGGKADIASTTPNIERRQAIQHPNGQVYVDAKESSITGFNGGHQKRVVDPAIRSQMEASVIAQLPNGQVIQLVGDTDEN